MAAAAKLRLQGGAVRLTMPARLANDLDGLQKTLAELAQRMGHPACATGCDTLFLQQEREFSVSEAVELNPQPIPPGRIRLGDALSESVESTVNVMLPERVSGNLKSLQKAIAVTVNKLGCAACCSGFDIAFRRELDLISVNDKVQAQGFGRFR